MHISIKQLRFFSLGRKFDIQKYDDLSFILNQVLDFVLVKNQKNYLQWRGTLGMRLEAIVMAT